MNRLIIIVVVLVIALALGFGLGRQWPTATVTSEESANAKSKILYYQAPMDPNYRRDKPGKSPMGMDLIPVYADATGGTGAGVVSIDPRIINNLGVRTARVEESSLSRRIETVGYVAYDEDTMHHVHTRVDGWIEELSVKATGDAVTRGQMLFTLYSPTLVNAQEEYLAVLQSRNPALHAASRDRLVSLGISSGEIKRLDSEGTVRQRQRFYAKSEGVVADLGVREGVYVTPATDVMAIADLGRVWVLAEVFERQSAWVKPGQRADVELDYLPGKRLQSTVAYVYPELDPKTRTLKVRLRFDNVADVLRPNMFARVSIYGAQSEPVLHVPQAALIRGGTVNRVVLALADGKFRSQPVEVGIEAGDRIEIRSGITASDRVVVSGQFLIDSESNIETALARLGAPEDDPPMAEDHSGHSMPATDMPMDHAQHHPVPTENGNAGKEPVQ